MTTTEPTAGAEAPSLRPGRPSAYEPEFAEQAKKLCALGATDADLADFFDVSDRTINRWKITQEAFCQALKAGKDEADARVERSLYNRANGCEWDEAQPIKLKKVHFGADGKKILEEEYVQIVMVHKVIPPDTTSCIFWLKNRKAAEWREKVELTGANGGPIETQDVPRPTGTDHLASLTKRYASGLRVIEGGVKKDTA